MVGSNPRPSVSKTRHPWSMVCELAILSSKMAQRIDIDRNPLEQIPGRLQQGTITSTELYSKIVECIQSFLNGKMSYNHVIIGPMVPCTTTKWLEVLGNSYRRNCQLLQQELHQLQRFCGRRSPSQLLCNTPLTIPCLFVTLDTQLQICSHGFQ